MTDDQRKMIDALKGVTFPVAHPHKRFARDMAQLPADRDLSIRQDQHLRRIVQRYWRQIPSAVVTVAGPPVP